MWKIDEDASFERCVLLDGRELEGDWWICRPLGVLGGTGILLAQDRASGNVVPLTSVMLLVAHGSGERSPGTGTFRSETPAPAVPSMPAPALRATPAAAAPAIVEAPALPAPALTAAPAPAARPASAPGSDWSDILRDDVPHELPELDLRPNPGLRATGL